MSSSSGKMKITIRYADYVETHHHQFLNEIEKTRAQTINDSPFSTYTFVDTDEAFLGAGYMLSDFPSLYDMFGKFMAGLDVCDLFQDAFKDILTPDEIDKNRKAEKEFIDIEITTKLIPTFVRHMRDLNAVASSSFIIGKTMIEQKGVKALANFGANLRYSMIPLIAGKWTAALNFQKTAIIDYAFTMKNYISSKMSVDEVNYRKLSKDLLWPFTVLEYERAAVATMQYSKNIERKKQQGRSDVSKGCLITSYAIMGAQIGYYFPPWGTLIGGIIGFIIGVAIILLE